MATPAPFTRVLLTLAALIGLAGCGEQHPAASEASSPPDVGVVTVKPRQVTLTKELPGRITPIRIARFVRASRGSSSSAASSRAAW